MIVIKNKAAIRKMRQAGALLSKIFDKMGSMMRPGVTTLEIDQWILSEMRSSQLESRTIGYMGYQHASCISLNDAVVHGVPSKSVILKVGDLVKVDTCASWKGYCADMARGFFVGDDGATRGRGLAGKLVETTQRALDQGAWACCPGAKLSDVSHEIQKVVEAAGFGVVRDFTGHGIGKLMHEEPEILNYGERGRGPLLRAGMTFALEPMVTAGKYEVYVDKDGWTARTVDGSLAAHVEDTVLITDDGPEILTRVVANSEN